MAIEVFKATTRLKEGMEVHAQARGFEVTIDEPESLGGTDKGMNPVELVLCALGACQAIVARIYAPKFEIELQEFRTELEGDLDLDGFLGKLGVRPGFSEIRYNIHIKADAPREKIEEFVDFICRHCPVGDTVAAPVKLVLNEVIQEK